MLAIGLRAPTWNINAFKCLVDFMYIVDIICHHVLEKDDSGYDSPS